MLQCNYYCVCKKSIIVKKLLLFLPFFLIFPVQGYFCPLHNHFAFTHALQEIDSKSHRIYPVEKPTNQVRIIVVPAGQDEQAQCLISATYRVLQEQTFDKIFIIGSSDTPFHGVALPFIINEDSYLSNMFLELHTLEKLSQYQLFHYYQVPFCDNKAMQQQFQFLEFYGNKNVSIVPLIVGTISQDDACEIAMIIAGYCTDKTLLILSGDIGSHINLMHLMPLDQSKNCQVYDQDVSKIQAIQSGSLEQHASLFDNSYHTSIFALLFELLQVTNFKDIASEFVGYTTSYLDDDNTGKDIQSYAAFIFQVDSLGYKNNVGSYEQSQLLQFARAALQDLFAVRTYRLPSMISYEMSQSHGIFASLYGMSDHGTILRGCMGKVQTKLPLHEAVYQMTQQSACKDLRFYPLRERDLDTTIISLSLLTDFMKVDDCSAICELDGILLQYDDKEAISLPKKVSVEDWSYESALIDLSESMNGARRFIWKKPRAKIFTFHSVEFQEE